MRALVTGASGFIGRHLTERLAREGHEVRALIRPGRDIKWLKALEVDPVMGVLADLETLEKAASGCDVVFHLAVARPTNKRNKGDYYSLNIEGARNVGRAALKAACRRVVHTSSASICGRGRRSPLDESSLPRPQSRYSASRYAAETVLMDLYRDESLPVVVLRFSIVVGPGSNKWLALMRAANRPKFKAIGRGNNRLQVAYIADVVDALICAAQVSGLEGEKFIVSGADVLTMHQYIESVRTSLGLAGNVRRLPSAPYRAFDSFARLFYRLTGRDMPWGRKYAIFLDEMTYDISKARAALGYEPKVGLRETVARMVQWYKAEGLL